jgi:hypothetical protein
VTRCHSEGGGSCGCEWNCCWEAHVNIYLFSIKKCIVLFF